MDLSTLPITAESLLTVAGLAAISAVVSQWLKSYLPDWRYTNLMVLLISEALAISAQLVSGISTNADVFNALLVGLWAASLATFGYEVVMNVLGKAGVGDRS